MRIALVLLAVLSARATAAPKLPAHYAKLFEANATWTYELHGVDPAKQEPDATCKVARTVTIGRVTATEITCDRELSIAGVFLAMPDGLYRSGFDFPATKDDLGDDSVNQLLIAAKPRATSKVITRYAPTPPVSKEVTTFGVRREDKQWCWFRITERGKTYRSTDTLCFSGGVSHGVDHGLAFRLRSNT